MRNRLLVAATIALLPILPGIAMAQAPVVTEAATHGEHAIREIKARWGNLIAAKNAAAIEALYADGAVLMPPNASVVVGREAIGARWASQLQLPDFTFRLIPEQLIVSVSDDLAYDRGAYDFAATISGAPIADIGKYVIVWQNIGGEWKVIADIFNSDAAAN